MITDRQGKADEGLRIVQTLLMDSQRVIDLGCGKRHHTKHLPNTVWVDIDPNHADDPRVLVMDVREAPHVFRRMHFDCAVLTDIIEHFPKDDGFKLIREVQPLADRVIIFTPLGEMWVDKDREPESPHHHRCGWMPFELEALGFKTWVWPKMHNFNGSIFGAFYAWKWIQGGTPTAKEISELSGIS